jgi:hypothetical protein
MQPSGQRPAQSPVRGYVLKGLGLVLVAVVSGMLWWLIQQGGNGPSSGTGRTSAATQGKYQFTAHEQVPDAIFDTKCGDHAYDLVKRYLEDKPCRQLIRALYRTTVDGRKALTSVSVVRMQNVEDAVGLKDLSERDKTGNVKDLVMEGVVKAPPLKNLGGGGYAAQRHDADVIIVESDFEGGSKKADEELLQQISEDAIRQGDQLRTTGSRPS